MKLHFCTTSTRKKTVFERSFFYPIRRIGMESPAGCMASPQAYGITRQRVSLLRIDSIHHFVMITYKDYALIPYRRQTADFIHAFGVIVALRANELTFFRFCVIIMLIKKVEVGAE